MSKLASLLVPGLAGTGVLIGGAYVAANMMVPQVHTPVAATLGLTAQAQQTAPADTVVFDLGRPATAAEIAAWDIDIRPDGAGLPDGSGDVWTGEDLYIDNCAVCHGDFGEAIGRWPVLAGGQGSLTNDRPVKTIGSYWPYLSTVYDYVNRAMPFGNAQSLTDDEVYAVTAYLLYLNDLVDDDFVLDRETLSTFEMPNRDAFYMDDRADTEYAIFTGEPCMENCKDTVEITARAAVVDVTPEDEAARIARQAAATGTDIGVTEADASAQVAAAETDDPVEEGTTPLAATATDNALADAGPDPELVAAGEKVFKQCSACHQVGDGARNRTGPMLNGIVDHPAGVVEGFRYSKVFGQFAEDGLVWTPEELSAFLAAPRDYAPRTKMSFRGLESDDDLAAVIAYLGTFAQ
ncbi:c-type cytochrome [Jannaschia donghaensis]|uniref:Cytochrome c2 n=1 Tax=Jannaschia donghaensis TaxID=420998 RepID=A0A0M6YNW8_9RHOB|nr:c-type cytochrome [Jannaschia donghaensis]CTQ51223.1 Cytochrome c2 [Jannaschia donghaensis]